MFSPFSHRLFSQKSSTGGNRCKRIKNRDPEEKTKKGSMEKKANDKIIKRKN